MRQTYCSYTNGIRVTLMSLFGIIMLVLMGTSLYSHIINYIENEFEILLIVPLFQISFGLIILVISLSLFKGLITGVKEWFSDQDWIIEVTRNEELRFIRPNEISDNTYLIKLDDISLLLKETKRGEGVDDWDVVTFFAVTKSGHRYSFDDYIPLDLRRFFKDIVHNFPPIRYQEIET